MPILRGFWFLFAILCFKRSVAPSLMRFFVLVPSHECLWAIGENFHSLGLILWESKKSVMIMFNLESFIVDHSPSSCGFPRLWGINERAYLDPGNFTWFLLDSTRLISRSDLNELTPARKDVYSESGISWPQVNIPWPILYIKNWDNYAF